MDIYAAILSEVAKAGFPSYLMWTYSDWFGAVAEDYEGGLLSFDEALVEAVRVARDLYNDPDFDGDTSSHDNLMEALERSAPGRFRTT